MDSQANSSATTHGWRKKVLWAGLILPALLVVVLYGKGKLAGNKTNPDTLGAKAVLSARVDWGTIERTIRLTGATSPAKYANLVSPRMRGGGQHTNQGGSINTGAGQASSVSSASSSSSGSSSSSNSTSGGGSVIAAFTRATVQSGGGGSATTAPSGTSGAAASSGTGAVSSGGAGGGTGGGGGGGGRMFGGALVLRELANPGTRVKSGDIVAEFDREDMLTRVDDFKAQIVQAEAGMRNLRAQLAVIEKAHSQTISVSKATLDKAGLDLKTIPVQPEITAEGLRLSAEEAGATHKQLSNEVQHMEASLQSQMRIAEMDLQENKAEFKRLQENAEKMILRAPLDGIVVMRTTYRGGEQGIPLRGPELAPACCTPGRRR